MKKLLILALLAVGVTLSANAQTNKFSDAALKDVFATLDGTDVTFESVLNKHAGKTIFIDLWASWCKDCREGLPGVKKLQKKYADDDVVFVFLSLDKNKDAWKTGVEKLAIMGDHYFINKGWKGSPFCQDIKLDWIPRYMIVNPKGEIEVYKSIKTDDKTLLKTLKVTK
ncbi:Thioredoxin-like [Zhouia amylolytica]|uniref:Thioredoxin-like n=1 Tax=Zhouia amylolytica TaxID=376730 RepID=A0A1I6RLT4_9FLAO|nr:TlpA disulfide reductase family protein [Zhouia amylolytica]MCQ0110537.1 TlpA family protein disulfide reductase [Zhouia amylolytica]SFS65560.1 Thioredoxin-like [Zhouia amylolytica]